MDLKRIKELIDLFAASDLSEIDFSEGGCRLRLVRRTSGDARPGASASIAETVSGNAVALAPVGGEAVTPVALDANDDTKEVVAPLHGVLHLTPAPDEPPFVKPGDPVRAGQTLGVLEAMKMFHTLKSDHNGIVAAILAASGSEVEAGQPLFRIT
jgi:acetyl-CoA carboxylase biotin carboxyl carrier protein